LFQSPRPEGQKQILKIPGFRVCGGAEKSVTGNGLRIWWWVTGESWGPPTPTRAGAGVFFGAGGPEAGESALFSGKIRGLTAQTPEFSCDLTVFSIGGYNECVGGEQGSLL